MIADDDTSLIEPAGTAADIGAAPAAKTRVRAMPEPASVLSAEAGLLDLFTERGFACVEPPVLQPLEPFLDLSGEDLRRRMFVTTDAEGHEQCLRPEYTIPVSRQHLGRADGVRSAAYAYIGPVFRFRAGESGEFRQAGVEDFGREDREAADADTLDVALEALNQLGVASKIAVIGDVGLFSALLGAMKLTGATERRLRRGYAAGKVDATMLTLPSGHPASENSHAGLLAALQGADAGAARLFVEDVLRIAGITTIGGRTAGQIAARFLEKASDQRDGLSGEQAQVVERFLAIAGHPDEAAGELRALAKDAGLDLGRALDTLDIRNGFIEARGIDLASLRFAAGFGRSLDYYTGFVFEIGAGEGPRDKPLVGGGRYDGLLRRLGAATDIPAVGCSIWLDRIVGKSPIGAS